MQSGRTGKISCRPETELNIMMGLCVGQDIIFNFKSQAPVTHLLEKDGVHGYSKLEHFNNAKKITKSWAGTF